MANDIQRKEKKKGSPIILWLIIFVLFTGIGFFAKLYMPKLISHERTIDVEELSGKIETIEEFATRQYDYRAVVRKDKDGFGSRMYIGTFDGTIKAGVNMAEADVEVINPSEDSEYDVPQVNVVLPKAEILSHEDYNPDTIYEEGFLGKELGAELNDLIKEQKKIKEKEAIEDGLLTKAENNAIDNITQFIMDIYGDDVVVSVTIAD